MDQATARKKAMKLRRAVRHHNYNYYTLGKPIISDNEYDELFSELRKLEELVPGLRDKKLTGKQARIFNIGRDGNLEGAEHMPFLNHTFSESKCRKFEQELRHKVGDDVELIAELKVDGLPISLVYRDGKLVAGLTRINGRAGENIIGSLMTIDDIPKSIKYTSDLEVAGEVYLTRTELKKLNEGKNTKKANLINSRAAAVKVLKQLGGGNSLEVKLNTFVYSAKEALMGIRTQAETLGWLADLGFKVNLNWEIIESGDWLKEYMKHWTKERVYLDYDVDGIIFKVNQLQVQKELGLGTHGTKWAMSYKFAENELEKKRKAVRSVHNHNWEI